MSFAEAEDGPECYIPASPQRRNRNMAIMTQAYSLIARQHASAKARRNPWKTPGTRLERIVKRSRNGARL